MSEEDMQLLMLAAKACGKEIVRFQYDYALIRLEEGGTSWWGPLVDGGDALRLAVTLKLKVYQGELCAIVRPYMSHSYVSEEYECSSVSEEYARHGLDKLSATCRAIVRAAAEIGKGIK